MGYRIESVPVILIRTFIRSIKNLLDRPYPLKINVVMGRTCFFIGKRIKVQVNQEFFGTAMDPDVAGHDRLPGFLRALQCRTDRDMQIVFRQLQKIIFNPSFGSFQIISHITEIMKDLTVFVDQHPRGKVTAQQRVVVCQYLPIKGHDT